MLAAWGLYTTDSPIGGKGDLNILHYLYTIWGWVKTLVPSEPQVIAGIYECSSHYSNVAIGIDP